MTSYRVAPAARADLRERWRYTAENWSASQADRYIALIEDAFSSIAAGTIVRRSAKNVREGYFRHSVQSHAIFYRIDKAANLVLIVRVLHQRMDLPTRLRES